MLHKWSHVLCCKSALLKDRLSFWVKTVRNSLGWGLENSRPIVKSMKRLHTTQCLQIVKMLGIKRHKSDDDIYEPWLDWHKRSFRLAASTIIKHKIDIRDTIKVKTPKLGLSHCTFWC